MRTVIDWLTSRKSIAKSSSTGSVSLLVLRVWIGSMMAFGHGWQKLMSYSEKAANFADPLGVGHSLSMALAISAEFFCSLLLILGLFTRGALIPIMFTMLMAALVIHSDDPWQRKELAALFLGALTAIFIAGPGKYSLDALINGKRS